MSAIPDSNLDPTQAWERSPEANPPSQGRARAIARQAEIRGSAAGRNAAREDSLPYPRRKIPHVA
jgi:hypothetical protein